MPRIIVDNAGGVAHVVSAGRRRRCVVDAEGEERAALLTGRLLGRPYADLERGAGLHRSRSRADTGLFTKVPINYRGNVHSEAKTCSQFKPRCGYSWIVSSASQGSLPSRTIENSIPNS